MRCMPDEDARTRTLYTPGFFGARSLSCSPHPILPRMHTPTSSLGPNQTGCVIAAYLDACPYLTKLSFFSACSVMFRSELGLELGCTCSLG